MAEERLEIVEDQTLESDEILKITDEGLEVEYQLNPKAGDVRVVPIPEAVVGVQIS